MRTSPYILGALVAGCWCAGSLVLLAQQDADILLDGVPLENAVVDRDIGFRFRGEVRFEDDYDGIIDTDANFARFPTRIYSGELTAFRKDRSYLGVSYARWDNDGDLDVDRWGGKFRYPVDIENDTFLYLMYNSNGTKDGNPYRYATLGIDRRLTEDFYLYLVYRNYHTEGTPVSHQMSAYVSWKPSSLMRVGCEVAGSVDDGAPGLAPWYTRLFGAIFLVPDLTSLRIEGLHYDTGKDYRSNTASAYLYQRLGVRTLVRADYRYYTDSQDLHSSAWGGKIRHYFSPAFAIHAGYRWYEHSEGTDFSGPYAGVDWLF